MILCIHIPKAGGTTLRSICQASYGPKIARDYGLHAHETDFRIRLAFNGYRESLDPRELRDSISSSGVEMIYGHFRARTYKLAFPDATWVTWIREPVSRIVSLYHQLKQAPDLANPASVALQDGTMNIVDFAKTVGNEQTDYLAGVPAERFSFIGLLEHFEEDVSRFFKVCKVDDLSDALGLLGLKSITPENVRHYETELDQATVEQIRAVLSEDVALYQAVLQSRESQFRIAVSA